jgi:pyruvate kinase
VFNRRTKIVATLGPATDEPGVLEALVAAGIDCARLNCSHGTEEDLRRRTAAVRAVAADTGRSIGLLFDLQGPKLRLSAGITPRMVQAGEMVTFFGSADAATDDRIAVDFEDFPRLVSERSEIVIGDGLPRLAVASSGPGEVVAQALSSGELAPRKGINVTYARPELPAITEKDMRDLALAAELGADFVALSFVRSAADIEQLRALLEEHGWRGRTVAKIEKIEAYEHLDEIIAVADGVMVARGDYGIEAGVAHVPLMQKDTIYRSTQAGKLVITATQMLESMITQPRPTRAEASDVANAVLDSTDALMLSGETASGAHPVEAVRTMARIIEEIEGSAYYRAHAAAPDIQLAVSANAIAHAAVTAANAMKIRTIVAVSDSGGAARLVSEYRPEANIVALTTSEVSYRRLALFWGVTPALIGPSATTEELVDRVEATLIERNLASPGESVLITMAVPVGSGMQTNVLKVHEIQR